MNVFWRKGFANASIDELAQASGTARASLYKLYVDKEGLFVAALDRYADHFSARVNETLAKTRDPLEAVGQTLRASADRLANPAAPDGCLRCRATLELTGRSPALDAAIARANRSYEENVRRLLDADRRGRASDAATARAVAAAVAGMVVLAQTGADRAALEDVVAGTLEVVRSRL